MKVNFSVIGIFAAAIFAGCNQADSGTQVSDNPDTAGSMVTVGHDNKEKESCPMMGEMSGDESCSMDGGSMEGCSVESGSMEGCSMEEGGMMAGGMSCCTGEEGGETVQASELPEGVVDLGNEKCPILGGNVNPNVYKDIEGFRVYFCCPGCDAKFAQSPREHLAALKNDAGVSAEARAKIDEFLNE